jgi:hypothetical protein
MVMACRLVSPVRWLMPSTAFWDDFKPSSSRRTGEGIMSAIGDGEMRERRS